MSKTTYSRNGSKTTQAIKTASPVPQWLWDFSHKQLNANIVRIRAIEDRFGYEQGETFDSFHYGKVSVYRQRSNPQRALYFSRKIPLTKQNKGMQILEMNRVKMNVDNTLSSLQHIKYVTETGYLKRLFNRIVFGVPMTLNS
jgi:lipopolysaccharide export LptBFGC system permease protein LptF